MILRKLLEFSILLICILFSIQLGYAKIINVADYGTVGDGIVDDGLAIRIAIANALPNDTIHFPSGKYAYSGNIYFSQKKKLEICGTGKETVMLVPLDWTQSALIFSNCQNIFMHDFKIDSPYNEDKERAGNPKQTGIFINGGSVINIDAVYILHVAGAGILFSGVLSGSVRNSEIVGTFADGIHITGNGQRGSSHIILENNCTWWTGDDSFSAVGYKGIVNEDISIRNNSSKFSQASGITVEGSENVEVYKNQIFWSRVFAIRAGSSEYWQTSRVRNVMIFDNWIESCPLEQIATIRVFAEYSDISDIFVFDNRIVNPFSEYVFMIDSSEDRCIQNLEIVGNHIYDNLLKIGNCFYIDSCLENKSAFYGNRIFRRCMGWHDCIFSKGKIPVRK